MATAEGNLLLRCLRKVGSHLQAKTGNQISSCDDIACIELSSSCCTEINIHIDETAVSGNLCSLLKEVKPLFLYDVEHGIAMEPMKENGLHLKLTWGTPSYFAFLR